MNLKDTYNRIAQDWNKDHEADNWWKLGTAKFVSYFKKGDKILDVGCAGGLKTKFFFDNGFDVTGVDLSGKMIELAKKRLPEVKFYEKDVLNPLEFPGMFDGVFAQAVLLHIPKKDILKVLQNLITTLKPNGYMYIAVKELKVGQKDEEIVTEQDYGYEYQRFFSYYGLEELVEYLEQLNMNEVFKDITLNGKTHWIQVISQKGT